MRPCFTFAAQFNNYTIQRIICKEFPGLEFNKHESVTSLLFILSDDAPEQSSLNVISPLISPSSKFGFVEPLSFQPKENPKPMMSRQYPKLKHFIAANIDFDGCIEDYFSISQLRLGLNYFWDFGFEAVDPMWTL
jgi:hypothetical protein